MKNSKRKIRVLYSNLKTQNIYIQFPKNQGILNLFIDKLIL